MNYDFIIVGGGASGLYTGVELLKRDPKLKIVILEQYDYLGGRVLTHRSTVRGVKYQWEDGAGRVSEKHPLVLGLIKRYNLHTHPIGNGQTNWYTASNPFLSLIPSYMKPLMSLPQSIREQSTVGELLLKVHGPKAKDFIALFPYWAEMHELRADLSLESFMTEFGGKEEFFVIAEGFQAITDGLAKEFKNLGGIVQFKSTVQDLEETHDGVTVLLKYGQLHGSKVILALPSEALKKIPSVQARIPALPHLVASPLVRMYAVFPVHKGTSWFSDLPSTVVNNPLRYIIPVNSAKGIIMISYTDGEDARHWMNLQKTKGTGEVKRQIMSLVRQTFPDKSIPNPHQFKIYPWSDGCTYWAPGTYDVEATVVKSRKISSRIFACGESLNHCQTWVEAALESANAMLKLIPEMK